MAAMVCSVLGRKKVISLVMASVCFTHPGPHSVLWSRGCSQYKQVPSNEDMPLLSQFISPLAGCTYGRHITGLWGKKQKEITKAIKRAQIMGFMPVTYKDPVYLKDPEVCNIKYWE
ncbi:28S ribosomal protein S18c, mitochondrial-like isoform X2 [Otolemur garnettii]|uniref:28S ribosomal protein S18c, mitochondrial-like isoform X2 n=1 Tax=Otolemur garnettii TaxID=30611 RepID=UPI000C7EAE9E|nr:28S ribosomal protein S18c, mitochondrial-like isoform X2 [Otolemur garnettii]